MARKTPGAVFLTWNDMCTTRGFAIVEEYLNLRKPLEKGSFVRGPKDYRIQTDLVSWCRRAYERYYYYLSHLPLCRFAKD